MNDLLPGDTVTVSSLSDIPATKPKFAYSLFRLFASGADIIIENEQRTLDAAEKRAMQKLNINSRSTLYRRMREVD